MCKDLDVKAIMDTWIKQKGYPVVHIQDDVAGKRSGVNALVANQKRFLRDMKSGTKEYRDEAEGYDQFLFAVVSPIRRLSTVNRQLVSHY